MEESSKMSNNHYEDIIKDFKKSPDKVRMWKLSDFTYATRFYYNLRSEITKKYGIRNTDVLVKECRVYLIKLD